MNEFLKFMIHPQIITAIVILMTMILIVKLFIPKRKKVEVIKPKPKNCSCGKQPTLLHDYDYDEISYPYYRCLTCKKKRTASGYNIEGAIYNWNRNVVPFAYSSPETQKFIKELNTLCFFNNVVISPAKIVEGELPSILISVEKNNEKVKFTYIDGDE